MTKLRIRQARGVHKGGTKEYTVTEVKGPSGTLIFRAWGPIGKKGDGKIQFASQDGGYDGIVTERRKSGYDMIHSPSFDVAPDELLGTLTPKHLTLLTDGWLKTLDSSLTVKDVPGAGGGSQKERDQMTDAILKATEEKRRVEAEAKRAAEEAEKAAAEAEMRQNPLFGMF